MPTKNENTTDLTNLDLESIIGSSIVYSPDTSELISNNTITPTSTIYHLNTTPSYLTTNAVSCYSWEEASSLLHQSIFSKFLAYLPVNDIIEIWNKIKDQILEEDERKDFLADIIKTAVFPEDFILENIEDLSKSDVFANHKNLICSGQYKELKLYYELKK